jgi:hypothetical protein
MKKVTLTIRETIEYQRNIIVEIPDDMSEDEFEEHLDIIEENCDTFNGYLQNLGDRKFLVHADLFDAVTTTPSSKEAVCNDYRFEEEVNRDD